MKEMEYGEALSDIATIKGVIRKTRKEFSRLSHTFFYWGIIVIFYGLYLTLVNSNFELLMDIFTFRPIIIIGIPLIFASITFAIYIYATRKNKLKYFEKNLLLVWVIGILLMTIPSQISISEFDHSVPLSISISNFYLKLATYGLLLFITSILTDIKPFRYLGIILFVIGFSSRSLDFEFLRVSQTSNILILSLSLFFVGLTLKNVSKKGQKNGYSINS